MPNWRRWLRSGVAATLFLALVAFFLRSGTIERRLTADVAQRLVAQGDDWAAITVSGRDVVLSGTAPSTEAVESALALAGETEGVRAVTDATTLLPLASPYLWTAKKLGAVVTLSGNVPSESSRNALLVEARRVFPDAEIHDEMTLARGASGGFSAGIRFGLTQLAKLSEGTVTLTDETLAVMGVAANANAFAEAREALRGDVPGAVVLGPVDIMPARADPFVWSASYDGKSITLEGFVPNEVVHETLLASAKATLARVPVVDTTTIASGEPQDFAEAASFAIAALGRLDRGRVALKGLDIDISGVSRTVDDYEAVLDGLANGIPKGAKVVSNTIEPAAVSPYGWQGEKDGSNVILTGFVPSLEGRDSVAAAAKALFPGLTVSNRVRVASGEPKMDWIGGVKFAMATLAKLTKGKVVLGDRTLDIEGQASSPDNFTDILAMQDRTLPASLQLDNADVIPPSVEPYRFAAELSAEKLSLSGYAPSQKDRDTILDTAQRKFGKVEIVDDLAYGSGAPADFLPAVSTALQAVARLGSGRADIVDDAVTISGSAYYPAAADEVASSTEDALPKGFKPTINIVTRQEGQPVSPVRCRDLLQDELQRGRIEFVANKAEITGDSLGLLDRVAATIQRCPDSSIEVGAHTDSGGSASKNRDLTQSRAEAIVDYLVDAGVKRERLDAVGYGATKPVADNGTTDGKMANRRIEFTVELPEGG